MKWYYLLQTAYWAQQLFVLVLKIEKPRKDYNELIIHHFVTIWLIGYAVDLCKTGTKLIDGSSWSYLVNMTWIGNCVFVTMDSSDTFLAASVIHASLCCTAADFTEGFQNV